MGITGLPVVAGIWLRDLTRGREVAPKRRCRLAKAVVVHYGLGYPPYPSIYDRYLSTFLRLFSRAAPAENGYSTRVERMTDWLIRLPHWHSTCLHRVQAGTIQSYVAYSNACLPQGSQPPSRTDGRRRRFKILERGNQRERVATMPLFRSLLLFC
jgi:hypothetical protein